MNNTVEGTAGNDVIDLAYSDDPELDRVDNNDNATGTDDDVIQAGDGDDTIVASQADDTIDGGAGNDTYQIGVIPESTSYQFNSSGVAASGYSVSSAGDVDGDGLDDVFIGAPFATGEAGFSGRTYLVSAADLALADAADGSVDQVIELDNISAQSTSYQFNGTVFFDNSAYSVSSAGDVDGDGRDDLIIGAFRADGGGDSSGESYLVTAADLVAADAADGTTDGVIDLDNVNEQSTSYQFIGTDANFFTGESVSSAGDVDGDGLDDLIIGAPAGAAGPGESYLVTAADLAAADAADGTTDGVIDLDNVNEQSTSYQFIGVELTDRSGVSVSSAGDVDGDGLDDLIIGGNIANDLEGESFLITAADLTAADAADGTTDGVIDLDNVNEQSTSYQFISETEAGSSGFAVSSAGDVDGDGLDDLIIGALQANVGGSDPGAGYLITSADLAAADAADGTTDGVIDLSNVNEQSTSYQFTGIAGGDQAGYSVSSAGDVDGDGQADLIIGAPQAGGGGESYLITAADLAAADAADGTADGVIDLDNVNEQSTSYQFRGIALGGQAGLSVSSAGDVDGDGQDDILIGAPFAEGAFGQSYLITAADLVDIDDANGTIDGVIDLDQIVDLVQLPPSVDVTVNEQGDGTSVKSFGGTDTLTSIETFEAAEGVTNNDVISLTNSADPVGFAATDITGIDDNAVGVFTPENGDPAINFGPSEAIQFSGILALNQPGQFQITAGDEDGTVGGISFSNFEQINFGVTCFTRGTLIKTLVGEKPIETLSEGDKVLTMDHGYQPIRWIGSRKLKSPELEANPKLLPIKIQAGALGVNTPCSELSVSPQHRVLVRSAIVKRMFNTAEVLIPANKLTSINGVDVNTSVLEVEYFHMLFDRHEIVYSNGAPSESLYTGPQALKSLTPEAQEEIFTIFPELKNPDFYANPARLIPEKGKLMKKLSERHASNNKYLWNESA